MGNPNYGFRFVNDGEFQPPKKRIQTDTKIFQASKMKQNKKRRK